MFLGTPMGSGGEVSLAAVACHSQCRFGLVVGVSVEGDDAA